MTTEYDTRTYIDKAGKERWVDDDTAINQNSAFRMAYGGERLDLAAMSRAAANSAAVSRALSRDMAAGKQRGRMRGMSRKSDEQPNMVIPDVYAAGPKLEPIAERQTQAYGKATGDPRPNWASMRRKGAVEK